MNIDATENPAQPLQCCHLLAPLQRAVARPAVGAVASSLFFAESAVESETPDEPTHALRIGKASQASPRRVLRFCAVTGEYLGTNTLVGPGDSSDAMFAAASTCSQPRHLYFCSNIAVAEVHSTSAGASTGQATAQLATFVADSWHHRVSVYRASDGAFVSSWGQEGDGDGEFRFPAGIAMCVTGDHHGQAVIVTEQDNARVQVFHADGRFRYKFKDNGVLICPTCVHCYVVPSARHTPAVMPASPMAVLDVGAPRAGHDVAESSAPSAAAPSGCDAAHSSPARGQPVSLDADTEADQILVFVTDLGDIQIRSPCVHVFTLDGVLLFTIGGQDPNLGLAGAPVAGNAHRDEFTFPGPLRVIDSVLHVLDCPVPAHMQP